MKKRSFDYLLLLLVMIIALFTIQCQNDGVEGELIISRRATSDGTQWDRKIYCNATIDDDFDGSNVLVIMDKKTGGVNKKHEKSFFGGIEIESINDLTEFIEGADIDKLGIDWENWRQILWIKLPGDSKENVLSIIRQLERIESILYAGPNYRYYLGVTTPKDPRYGNQWGLSNTVGIQAPVTWDYTVGSSNVLVGIIDTGIAPHPDLNANLVSGRNFIPGANIYDTNDTNGHGTHVAGIVGAVGHNNVGISGVCWNIGLVPLKISGSTIEIVSALTYARNSLIPIVNFSWWNGPNDSAF